MRNILNPIVVIYITIMAAVISCSKKSSSPDPVQLITTFKFTGNGTVVQWNGLAPLSTFPSPEGSIIQKSSGFYFISAHPANHSLATPWIYLKIPTANLIAGGYSYTLTAPVMWTSSDAECIMPTTGAPYYTVSEIGDNVTINISRIHDGNYADGSFSALMSNTPNGTSNKLTITNGEFVNVRIDQ